MKHILFFLLLIIGYADGFSQSNDEKLIAMCCDERRRCTGSAYCTACKNCSGCKYCAKNGGTCGVCNGNKSYRSKSKTLSKGTYLYVAVPSINLREGPGPKYKIIKKLKKGTKLMYLSRNKSWIRVKAEVSGSTGYVYYKYVH